MLWFSGIGGKASLCQSDIAECNEHIQVFVFRVELMIPLDLNSGVRWHITS